jgi:hypothetical protein
LKVALRVGGGHSPDATEVLMNRATDMNDTV